MVPCERVKRERRALWLDLRSESKSVAAPATVSGEPLVRAPHSFMELGEPLSRNWLGKAGPAA